MSAETFAKLVALLASLFEVHETEIVDSAVHGCLASFLEHCDCEFSGDVASSDDDLFMEAMLDGFFDEFPEASPAVPEWVEALGPTF